MEQEENVGKGGGRQMKDGERVDEGRHPQWHREMKNLLRETFSHHQAGRQLAWSQPPLNSEDLLVIASPNLIIIFSITLSSESKARQPNGGKRGKDGEKRVDTSDLHAS